MIDESSDGLQHASGRREDQVDDALWRAPLGQDMHEPAAAHVLHAAVLGQQRHAEPSERRGAQHPKVFGPDAAKPADILASFQRFYFDTALSSGPAALPSLKAFAGRGCILFGSDFPYAPAAVAASFTARSDAEDDLTADEHRAISHGNAWTLFPRLSPQHDIALAQPRQNSRDPETAGSSTA
jgi:hypothetical protein